MAYVQPSRRHHEQDKKTVEVHRKGKTQDLNYRHVNHRQALGGNERTSNKKNSGDTRIPDDGGRSAKTKSRSSQADSFRLPITSS